MKFKKKKSIVNAKKNEKKKKWNKTKYKNYQIRAKNV